MTITENVLKHQANIMMSNRLTYPDIIRLMSAYDYSRQSETVASKEQYAGRKFVKTARKLGIPLKSYVHNIKERRM